MGLVIDGTKAWGSPPLAILHTLPQPKATQGRSAPFSSNSPCPAPSSSLSRPQPAAGAGPGSPAASDQQAA